MRNDSLQQGTVVAVDTINYRVRCRRLPSGNVTGWLRVSSQWVGQGWGLYALPAVGDQVVLAGRAGNFADAIVVAAVFDLQNIPTPTPPLALGEIRLVHQMGSFLQFLPTGVVRLSSPNTLSFDATTLSFTGNTVFVGDVTVFGGDLTATGNITTLSGNISATGGNISASGTVTGSNIP